MYLLIGTIFIILSILKGWTNFFKHYFILRIYFCQFLKIFRTLQSNNLEFPGISIHDNIFVKTTLHGKIIFFK